MDKAFTILAKEKQKKVNGKKAKELSGWAIRIKMMMIEININVKFIQAFSRILLLHIYFKYQIIRYIF